MLHRSGVVLTLCGSCSPICQCLRDGRQVLRLSHPTFMLRKVRSCGRSTMSSSNQATARKMQRCLSASLGKTTLALRLCSTPLPAFDIEYGNDGCVTALRCFNPRKDEFSITAFDDKQRCLSVIPLPGRATSPPRHRPIAETSPPCRKGTGTSILASQRRI